MLSRDSPPQALEDCRLKLVRVLEFIHQDVSKALSDLLANRGVGDEMSQIEQQIVIVEDLLTLLAVHIGWNSCFSSSFQSEHQGK